MVFSQDYKILTNIRGLVGVGKAAACLDLGSPVTTGSSSTGGAIRAARWRPGAGLGVPWRRLVAWLTQVRLCSRVVSRSSTFLGKREDGDWVFNQQQIEGIDCSLFQVFQ